MGDPACTLSAIGNPDASLIPSGSTRVGLGRSGDYYCLIF